MSGLDQIGVQVVSALDDGARSYVPALLREIERVMRDTPGAADVFAVIRSWKDGFR